MASDTYPGFCAGHWADGRPCKNRPRARTGYCALHEDGRVSEPCRHTAYNGRRCRANPGFGSAYCYYHEPVPAQVRLPRAAARRFPGDRR